MNRFAIFGLLCAVGLAMAASAGTCLVCPEFERHFEDGFTLSFSLKGLFLDTGYWNEMIPEGSGLPELGGLVRLHGATVAVPISS